MRIGIDATVLDRGITGTGRFLYNILKELPGQDNKNEYSIITGTELEINKGFYKTIFSKQSLIPYKIYSPIWFNVVLPKILRKHKIDLLFAPNVLIPLVDLDDIKKIVVVHDIIFKIYKEYYPFFYRQYLSLFLPVALKKSDLIITVSEHSKKDIIKYFNVPHPKIEVVYNTASLEFNDDKITDEKLPVSLAKLNLPPKYLLFVGAIEKRKNILGLLKIIDLLKEHGSDLDLVLVGKKGFGFESILPEIEKRENYVKFFNSLRDENIAYIYKLAFAFVFPSYYEGFGIPPLEAMQSGIPVLSSNTSALPEVVGEGGTMHDPDDYYGFVTDILKLERDSDYYSLMKIKALEQSKRINIVDTTKKLVRIFNEFL